MNGLFSGLSRLVIQAVDWYLLVVDRPEDRSDRVGLTGKVACAVMGKIGILGKIWLNRFSSPATERPVVRQVIAQRPARILELGLGTLQRTEKIVRLASRVAGSPVHYVGLDRFEARQPGDPQGVTLKEAHRRLHNLGRIQLVPGNVDSSLARLCNHLGHFDLILISAATDQQNLTRCWFFLQRLIRPETALLQEVPNQDATPWRPVSHERVSDLASQTLLRRAG